MYYSETQELLLKDEYIEWVKKGIKNNTIRLGERPIQLGKLKLSPASREGDSIFVHVTCVESKTVNDLSFENAKSDGFKSVPDLILALIKFYPDMKADDKVTVIYW